MESLLSAALQTAAERLFPGHDLRGQLRFQPMLDLEKGELSARVAIELANRTRQSAAEIAAQLLAEVAPVCGGSWRVDAGYLVLVHATDAALEGEFRVQPKFQPLASAREVVCLVPDVTTPVYARLRVVACAALQALLTVVCEGQVRVHFVPCAPRTITTRAEVVAEVQRVVEYICAHPDEVRRDPELPKFPELNPAHTQPSVVWSSHHFFDAIRPEVKRALVAARSAGKIALRLPGDGWLLRRDRALSELLEQPYLERILGRLVGTEGWIRWILHAAGTIPSGDFDPAVALYDEAASPFWNVTELRRRFERLVGPVAAFGDGAAIALGGPIDQKWRALLLRALFLPSWTAQLVEQGEVAGWSQVVCELSAMAHRFLNDPTTRAILAARRDDCAVGQIVAGVGFGLSSILALEQGAEARTVPVAR